MQPPEQSDAGASSCDQSRGPLELRDPEGPLGSKAPCRWLGAAARSNECEGKPPRSSQRPSERRDPKATVLGSTSPGGVRRSAPETAEANLRCRWNRPPERRDPKAAVPGSTLPVAGRTSLAPPLREQALTALGRAGQAALVRRPQRSESTLPVAGRTSLTPLLREQALTALAPGGRAPWPEGRSARKAPYRWPGISSGAGTAGANSSGR